MRRTVLLATGIADAGLPIENWREAVASGAVRLCPVCDGYDVIDKRIAVSSANRNPVGHALFLRTFTDDVTLFDRDEASLPDSTTTSSGWKRPACATSSRRCWA